MRHLLSPRRRYIGIRIKRGGGWAAAGGITHSKCCSQIVDTTCGGRAWHKRKSHGDLESLFVACLVQMGQASGASAFGPPPFVAHTVAFLIGSISAFGPIVAPSSYIVSTAVSGGASRGSVRLHSYRRGASEMHARACVKVRT